MNKYFPSVLIALSTLPVMAIVAQASPVRTITISPGYGVTILTGEPIYKVWVDDGSKIGIDFDRPPEEGATIIQVYQNRKPHAEYSVDGNTMMTLVSQSGQVQKIKIVFGRGPIKQTVLSLESSERRNLLSATFTSNSASKSDRIGILREGFRKAVALGRISENGDLYRAVDKFIALMSGGASFQKASEEANVSLEVIAKLAKLGIESSGYRFNPSTPEPSRPSRPGFDRPTETTQISAPEGKPRQFTLADYREPSTLEAPSEFQTSASKESLNSVSEVEQEMQRRNAQRVTAVPIVALEKSFASPSAPTTALKPSNHRSTQVAIASQSRPLTENFAQEGSDYPNGSSKALAVQIERGLNKANRSGEVRKYSAQGLAVQAMLKHLKWGASLPFAAQKYKVSPDLVNRLLSLGQVNTVAENPREIANSLVRGLSLANATGEIGYANYESYKVQDVVRLLRRGHDLQTAMRYSGVSQSLIDRLLLLGKYQNNG